MANILIVLSAANKWTRADGSTYDSGVWAEEFVVLDETLINAGFNVDIATPDGDIPTIDARSLNPKIIGQDHADHFRDYLSRNASRLETPLVLATVDAGEYDAIVIPGGHGPVEDLYKDPDMGRLLVEASRSSKVIASVCHGPAAFLAAKSESGEWPFAGRKMTSFSDEEEIEFGTAENAPWLLASSLRKLGARYEKGPNWGAFIVKDDNLLTGQNPASTGMLADAVVAALS
jgi:putative intracellular protease/amidase